MRKLLLAFAGLSVIGATAQEARMDLGRSAAMYTASHADGTPLNTSSNKSAAAVYTGTAPNVYGAGFGPKTNLVANEAIILYLHELLSTCILNYDLSVVGITAVARQQALATGSAG